MFTVTIRKQGERELIKIDNVVCINTTTNGATLELYRFLGASKCENYPLNEFYLWGVEYVDGVPEEMP